MRISLNHGDCVAGMLRMETDSVDVVVTSPPYNLGIKYSAYHDLQPEVDYMLWSMNWINQVARILRPDGSFFLNVGASSKKPFLPFELATLAAKYFKLQNTIHWIKSISVDRDGSTSSFGHFKPINSDRYLNDCHEYIFHFTKGGDTKLDRLAVGVPYADKSNLKRWSHTGGRDVRCRGNTWFIPYKTIQKRSKDRPHPATFPVELARKCIRLHGKKNCVVVDPFVGIGSSAVAALDCHQLVSEFYGFDIDEEYIRQACTATGQASFTKV